MERVIFFSCFNIIIIFLKTHNDTSPLMFSETTPKNSKGKNAKEVIVLSETNKLCHCLSQYKKIQKPRGYF